MQETNFPTEILIHDDASSDGTAEIVSEYARKFPTTIKPVLQTVNQWSLPRSGELLRSLKSCRGRYIAICDGDDYWPNAQKLQTQYDHMQKHEHLSMVCTRYQFLEGERARIPSFFKNISPDHTFFVTKDNWFRPYVLMTCTAMIRSSFLASALARYTYSQSPKDIFLWRMILEKGPAEVLPVFTAFYRLHRGGVHSSLPMEKSQQANLETVARMRRYFVRITDSAPDLNHYYNKMLYSLLPTLIRRHLYYDLVKTIALHITTNLYICKERCSRKLRQVFNA